MSEVNEINGLERGAAGETSFDAPIRLTDLHPNDAVVRTNATAPQTIDGTETPGDRDRIGAGKITFPPVRAMAVENAASHAGIGTRKQMPDFAFAVVNLATAREAHGSEKLKGLAGQVREQLGDVDLLLDLSSELTSLPDKDSHDVSDTMRNLIEKLEIRNIQVWKSDAKISKDKLSEMKAQIGSQIDKLRTAIQTKISTEIQPETNNLQAIMNIVQQIIQSDARLIRKATEVPR